MRKTFKMLKSFGLCLNNDDRKNAILVFCGKVELFVCLVFVFFFFHFNNNKKHTFEKSKPFEPTENGSNSISTHTVFQLPNATLFAQSHEFSHLLSCSKIGRVKHSSGHRQSRQSCFDAVSTNIRAFHGTRPTAHTIEEHAKHVNGCFAVAC